MIFEDVKDQENAIDLLEKMLTFIPEDRITAEEALKHKFFDEVRPNM